MLFGYTIITVIMIVIGKRIYKNMINPLSMYGCLWYVCFFFHECGIVNFSPITFKTYFMIIMGNVYVTIGCLLGNGLSYVKFSKLFIRTSTENEKKTKLYYWIIILSLVCGIDVLLKFYRQIQLLGTNIFMNFAYRYSSQLRTVAESDVDLSSLIFPLAVLISIYIVQFGLEKKLALSIVVLVLFSFIQGSRGTLIIVMLLFLSQVTITGRVSSYTIDFEKNKKKIIAIFLILFLVVAAITLSRARYFNSSNSSNGIADVLGPMMSYTAEGIGCLDKYMEQPETADYPQYFLRVPIIVLNKLGITNLDTRYYISTYYIPFPSNVITYLGELYHDFGKLYGVIVIAMSMFFSMSYTKSVRKNSYVNRTFYSVFFVIFMLSFFANFFHVASVWYVAVIGGLIAITIEYKILS